MVCYSIMAHALLREKDEECHNFDFSEPSRNRSKSIGTSFGKSSVELKSYYARVHRVLAVR